MIYLFCVGKIAKCYIDVFYKNEMLYVGSRINKNW